MVIAVMIYTHRGCGGDGDDGDDCNDQNYEYDSGDSVGRWMYWSR